MKLVKRVKSDGQVLIVADPAMEGLGHLERLTDALKSTGANVESFTDIVSDPKESAVNKAISTCSSPDTVIALGGGSTMDAAKVIASLISTGEKCEDYRMAAKRLPSRRTTLIAVPTTAGTGSEATNISVLTSDEGVKYWYAARGQEPNHIIIDPELFVDLPAFLTAATGCDALVHAVEASTNVHATNANSIFAHEAIRRTLFALPKVISEPGNLDLRAEMAFAATLAGIAINNAGTAIAHAIGHALASLSPMHHGLSVTLGLGASLPILTKENTLFDDIAPLFGVSKRGDIAQAFDDFVMATGLNLSHYASGVSPADLAAQMIKPENMAMLNSTKLEPTDEMLLEISEATLAYTRG